MPNNNIFKDPQGIVVSCLVADLQTLNGRNQDSLNFPNKFCGRNPTSTTIPEKSMYLLWVVFWFDKCFTWNICFLPPQNKGSKSDYPAIWRKDVQLSFLYNIQKQFQGEISNHKCWSSTCNCCGNRNIQVR